jgi:hypothetical protein
MEVVKAQNWAVEPQGGKKVFSNPITNTNPVYNNARIVTLS